MYDIIVIGGGIVGSAILRKLSHTSLNVLMLEKCDDVSCGSSRANSGIVHGGYDAETGTLKAKFNVQGNKMYFGLAKELNVPCQQIGSLILADKDGLDGLNVLFNRGKANGVDGLKILNRDEILAIEPNIADNIQHALLCKAAGIVSPYEMTIALAEQAVLNGAKVNLSEEVIAIKNENNTYTVKTTKSEYKASVIINCAGYGCAQINTMANEESLKEEFKRGDYYIFDSVERKNFSHTCFPLPNKEGKGILVSPTADGNIIVGPTSVGVNNGLDTAITQEGLDIIKANVSKMMKNVNFGKGIRVFAGVRSAIGDDFVIKNGKNKNFIMVAGICSPGLTAAPAIAEYVVNDLLKNTSIKAEYKPNYIIRPKMPVTRELTKEQWKKLIKENNAYSKIVCRCEKITEGEIIDALNSPLLPRSLDCLKRRVRTGMGRCQGGFCTPKILDIISKHCNMPLESVTKEGYGSEIIIGDIKESK